MSKNETGRLESFSDGVFAVAITLLVLNLKVPTEKEITIHVDLWHLLEKQWPSFLAFITSFITILFIWLNHHMVMRLVHANNGSLMLINGLLLLFVTLLPFSTAVLAEHLGHSGSKESIVFYSGLLFAVACMFQAFWNYAVEKERLLGPESDLAEVKRIDRQFFIGFLLYLIAFASSFFMPYLGLCLCVLLAAYFMLVGIFAKHR